MSSNTQAPAIASPVQNVVIETYIGTGPDGPIPHTFLKVTDSNGTTTYVGFAPQVTGLTGPGEIIDNINHAVFDSSGPIPLTPQAGALLQQYINNSIANPPYYDLPEGSQCAVWALNGLLYAMTGNSNLLNSTNEVSYTPYGPLLTTLINPYSVAWANLELQLGRKIDDAVSALDNAISSLLGNAQNQVIDPLVISTNGQAVTTTSLANGAFVDYQGTGFEEQSSWLSSNAGILVDVTNPTGTLNNGFTIIGSSTTNQNGNKLGQAGFTQLATLDTNHDGVINASDTDFSQIEILMGSNGQPGSGHLETLAQAGITSISLNSTAVNTTDANGDKTLATSAVTYGNGTTGTLSDMNMSVNTSNTIDESAGTINSAYANLPNVAGWGDVHNLQVAMALDTSGTLAGLVQQYLAATPAQQATLINNLIFTWTGVQNNAPETAYHFTGDTREIDALSKFVGAQYSNNSGWSTTLVTAAGVPMVQAAWNQLVNYVSGCLLNYGTNQNLFTDVKLTYNSTTQSFTYDVSGLVNALSSMSTMQQLEFGTFLSGSSAYNGIVSALNAYFPTPSNVFQNTIATLGTTQQASVIISSNEASLVLDNSTILSGSNDTVSVGTALTLTLASGSNNTVTQSYTPINFFVQAANSSNTLSGNYGTFDVTAQATGDALTLAGSGNTLTQTGGDAYGSVSVTGSSDTLNLSSTGVAVAVSGSSDTLNLGGSTITASNANSLTVNGNSDTIDTTGTTYLTVNGNTSTIDATGTNMTNLTVNGSASTITASGVSTLNLSGNATLNGSNDTVNVGSGVTLTVASGSGANTFNTSNGASDILAFGSGVTSQQLWFSRSGNNLLATVDGTHETETVNNWFSSTLDQIGTVSDGYGATISASGINSLVQAMASMTPPPLGQTTLSAAQAQQLAPVLAANWH